MTEIITSIITGAIIGALGRLLLPGKQNISILITVAIGIVAGLVGGLLLGLFNYENASGGIPFIYIAVSAVLAALGIVGYGQIVSKR